MLIGIAFLYEAEDTFLSGFMATLIPRNEILTDMFSGIFLLGGLAFFFLAWKIHKQAKSQSGPVKVP